MERTTYTRLRRFIFIADWLRNPIYGWAHDKADMRALVRAECGLSSDASLGRHAVVSVAA